MRNLSNEFRNKRIDFEKLLKYGFVKENNKYIYNQKISNNEFSVNIVITNLEQYSKLIDLESNSEFALVDVETSVGEFVGNLRIEYENIIKDVIQKCTIKEVFKNEQTKEIIEYIRKKYCDELEFLWEKFDDNAIWRNKQNNKWYGVLLTITESKLKNNVDKDKNIDSNKTIEIIDLRYQKEEIENIIDGKKIFPGYHMNKKSWITINLDNSVNIKTIFNLIDNSYNLSIGNKCGLAGYELSQKIYNYLTKIPKGKVVTYKQVAEYLGNRGLARAVGSALHRNPNGDKYPCYKVLNSKGELAEAFVFGGKEIQRQRLEKDGIKVVDNKVDLSIYQWQE